MLGGPKTTPTIESGESHINLVTGDSVSHKIMGTVDLFCAAVNKSTKSIPFFQMGFLSMPTKKIRNIQMRALLIRSQLLTSTLAVVRSGLINTLELHLYHQNLAQLARTSFTVMFFFRRLPRQRNQFILAWATPTNPGLCNVPKEGTKHRHRVKFLVTCE